MKTATVAEAKVQFSKIIGDVAHGGPSVLITKRDQPMAKLVPVRTQVRAHVAKVKGWLDKNDPFFEAVDEIVALRAQYKARQ